MSVKYNAYKVGKNKIAVAFGKYLSTGAGRTLYGTISGNQPFNQVACAFDVREAWGFNNEAFDNLVKGCPKVELKQDQLDALIAHRHFVDMHEPYVSATIVAEKSGMFHIEYIDVLGDMTYGSKADEKFKLENELAGDGFESVIVQVSPRVEREFWIGKDYVTGYKQSVIPNPNGYPRVKEVQEEPVI